MDHLRQEAISAVVQAVPAVTVVGAHLLGLSLSEWGAVFAIAFISLQSARLIYVWRMEIKDRRSKDEKPK